MKPHEINEVFEPLQYIVTWGKICKDFLSLDVVTPSVVSSQFCTSCCCVFHQTEEIRKENWPRVFYPLIFCDFNTNPSFLFPEWGPGGRQALRDLAKVVPVKQEQRAGVVLVVAAQDCPPSGL